MRVSRLPRRRSRSSGEAWKIWLGIGLALLAAVGVGLLLYAKFSAEKIPERDKVTLCPVEGPRSITVVLIDASDKLPDTAKSELVVMLTDVAESIPRYGLLELRTLKSGEAGGHLIFSRCNPGDGSDQSALTSNPLLSKKKWISDFRTPLADSLRKGLQEDKASSSPIMSTIQRIAIEKFSSRAVSDLPKSLFVVSDMIEHSPPDYSQYSGEVSYDRYKRSTAYKKFRTDLRDALVTIDYIQRKTQRPINSADHMRFWREWIKDNNGRINEFRKIQGLE
jgi:hypothetical protein